MLEISPDSTASYWEMEGSISMTIEEFIQQRFEDAKVLLEQIDGPFVTAVNAAQALSLKNIQVSQVKPTTRFPKKWAELLETCVDVTSEIELLGLITNAMDPKNFENRPKDDVGREVTRHLFDWVIHEQALFDKVELLIKRTLAVALPKGRRKFRQQLGDKYDAIIWEGGRKRFSASRSGLVHGAGDEGTVFKAISEDYFLESAVALGISMDAIISTGRDASIVYLEKWHRDKVAQTKNLLIFLGDTLQELSSDLAEQPVSKNG